MTPGLDDALALLGPKFDSIEARGMLWAIGRQESRFKHRRQIGGPARGFWQFERGGGVRGVLTHRASNTWTGSDHSTTLNVRLTGSGSTSLTSVFDMDVERAYPVIDNSMSNGLSTNRWESDHVVNRNTHGAEYETGTESPATWAANTDNLAIASTTRILRISASAAVNLTGVVAPSSGRRVLLINIGANNITLTHNATSTAANQFRCPGGVSFVLNPNDSVEIWYDITTVRWRVLGS